MISYTKFVEQVTAHLEEKPSNAEEQLAWDAKLDELLAQAESVTMDGEALAALASTPPTQGAIIKQLIQERDQLRAFKTAVVGWRESDHPEWFSRATAEWVVEFGEEAERRGR